MFEPDAVARVTHKLRSWGGDFVGLLPNLAVAIVVLVVFVLLSKLVKRLVCRALKRISKHVQVNELIASATRLVVMVAGLFIALGILKLDKTVTSLLAGVGVVGLALGFAFKDIAANYVSGVLIAVRAPFEVGDLVTIKDFFGTVHSLDLRTTTIRMPSGELVLVPNQEVLGNPIINWTRSGERRVELPIGVSYSEDLDKVRRVVIEAVGGIAERDGEREAELYFTGFGDSSIDFEVRFWIHGVAQNEFLRARSAALVAIKKAFDASQIVVPFPMRTVEFSVEASQKLDKLGDAATPKRSANGRRHRAS